MKKPLVFEQFERFERSDVTSLVKFKMAADATAEFPVRVFKLIFSVLFNRKCDVKLLEIGIFAAIKDKYHF